MGELIRGNFGERGVLAAAIAKAAENGIVPIPPPAAREARTVEAANAAEAAKRPYMPTYEPSYGAKYERGLSRKEVAVRIRADLKAAVKAGELPRAKYSVRIENYAGGGSVTIRASELGFEVLSEARVLADHDEPHRYNGIPWMSGAAKAVEEKLEAIGGAYNRDASDSMVDYFDCDYYLHVKLDYPAGERAAILARNGRVA